MANNPYITPTLGTYTLNQMSIGKLKAIDNAMIQNPVLSPEDAVFNYDLNALKSEYYANQNFGTNGLVNNYLKPLNLGVSTLSTLGGLYLGFKQYGLAKEQLSMAKEQWNRTKQELDRIQNVRKKLTDSYMNG